MNTRDTVAARIVELCKERHISINRLAELSAVPPSTVKNVLYGRSDNPGVVTIKKICDGLDITLGEFFDTPAMNSLEQEIR
ncbi:helix-turn-helix transcriptional regulator [Butyricicoccus faecihominis]|uniref:helix-turn-helix domain-containing protein n=1 Tax=Butyricicoccaceae TaxID=3085642 RepID=UPI002478FA92|nr:MULTISPECIES: helix-turn-helix transcriptional regulator [Butyricicoccaceae]MCQ5128346.1 helix-turn-helix transcriptional regulator [Butyricicoccus faecihominis]WNX83188.1 helix-turn-helix transcriptional regulator [Agathobaculum sp. NTUH-O15-33]